MQNRIYIGVYVPYKSFATLATCALKHTCATTKNEPQKSKNKRKDTEQVHTTSVINFPTNLPTIPPGKKTPNHQNKRNKVFGGHTHKHKCSQNGDNKFSCQVLRANQITGTTLSDQSENFSTCDK